MYFNHDKLECYAVALDVARWAARVKVPTGRKHLRDQLVRSADSMVLNIAEAAGLPPGDARRHHFRIALGSAAEVAAAIDLIGAPGPADDIRRVGAMLAKLSRL